MNIEMKHLTSALHLCTGKPVPDDEAESLAFLLDVPEEVLPYLVLKLDAFVDHPAIGDALFAAAKRLPAPPSTRRVTGPIDRLMSHAAQETLTASMSALIEQQVADQSLADALDEAMGEVARLGKPAGFDAHLRIRR